MGAGLVEAARRAEGAAERKGPPTFWHPGNMGGPFAPARSLHQMSNVWDHRRILVRAAARAWQLIASAVDGRAGRQAIRRRPNAGRQRLKEVSR